MTDELLALGNQSYILGNSAQRQKITDGYLRALRDCHDEFVRLREAKRLDDARYWRLNG
jgi:hypothetical protein